MRYEDLTVAQRTLFHEFKQKIRSDLAAYLAVNPHQKELSNALERFFDCVHNNISFDKLLPHLHDLVNNYLWDVVKDSHALYYTYNLFYHMNLHCDEEVTKKEFVGSQDSIRFVKLKEQLNAHFQELEGSQYQPLRDAKVDLYLKEFYICFEAGECFIELFPDHFNYLCEYFSHLRWLGDVNCAIIYNSLLYLSRHPRQQQEASPSKESNIGLHTVGALANACSSDAIAPEGKIFNDSWTVTLKLKEEEEEEGNDGPAYYQGQEFDVIDIIEQFELDFHLGNVVKYILRAGKKHGESLTKDLDKARWYLDRYIDYVGEGV